MKPIHLIPGERKQTIGTRPCDTWNYLAGEGWISGKGQAEYVGIDGPLLLVSHPIQTNEDGGGTLLTRMPLCLVRNRPFRIDPFDTSNFSMSATVVCPIAHGEGKDSVPCLEVGLFDFGKGALVSHLITEREHYAVCTRFETKGDGYTDNVVPIGSRSGGEEVEVAIRIDPVDWSVSWSVNGEELYMDPDIRVSCGDGTRAPPLQTLHITVAHSALMTDKLSGAEGLETEIRALDVKRTIPPARRRLCLVCSMRERVQVCVPCGHVVACAACAPGLSNCPTCHNKVDRAIKAMYT